MTTDELMALSPQQAFDYLRSDEFRRAREDAAAARLGHDLFAKQLIRADQADKTVQELAMIVRNLCYALSKRAPDHSALKQARDYLASHGLQGSLLRNAAAIDAAREGEG